MGCHFDAHVLDCFFGKTLQIDYIVHFGNRLENTVPNSIAEECLLDEAYVRCIISLSFRQKCIQISYSVSLHQFDIPPILLPWSVLYPSGFHLNFNSAVI